jgi:hypothetical protein
MIDGMALLPAQQASFFYTPNLRRIRGARLAGIVARPEEPKIRNEIEQPTMVRLRKFPRR